MRRSQNWIWKQVSTKAARSMQARVSTRQTSASREPSQYFRVTMFTDMEETEAPPPGSNRLCSHSTSRHRFRKEWRSLSAQEREVFVSTLELSITQQKIQSIVRYHTYPRSSFQSHTTCGFILWHRSFLLAVEDMLRDLAPPRTSCLTIPYWDVTVDYHRQNTMGSCFSMASCAPGLFLELMGGVPGFFQNENSINFTNQTEARIIEEFFFARGVPIVDRPVSQLVDEDGKLGLVRQDLWRVPIPDSADPNDLADLIHQTPDWDEFTTHLQRQVHDDVHVNLGGFMPTFASPIDVFFWVWHASVDWIYMLWQSCHNAMDVDDRMGRMCKVRPLLDDTEFLEGGEPPLENPDVHPQPSSTDAMIFERENGTIHEDPFWNQYFSSFVEFGHVADVSLLGDSSYSYQFLSCALFHSRGSLSTTFANTVRNATTQEPDVERCGHLWVPSTDWSFLDPPPPTVPPTISTSASAGCNNFGYIVLGVISWSVGR